MKVTPTIVLMVAALGLAACGTVYIEDESHESGSSVQYVPRPSHRPASVEPSATSAKNRSTRPDGPPARVSGPASYVPTRASGGSSVRYEAIRRADAITSEALWGQNDDHDRLDDTQPPEHQP